MKKYIKIKDACATYEIVRKKLNELRADGTIREKKHKGSYVLLLIEDLDKHLIKREQIK